MSFGRVYNFITIFHVKTSTIVQYLTDFKFDQSEGIEGRDEGEIFREASFFFTSGQGEGTGFFFT